MRSLGWARIQYGGCPYEKRLGHRHTQRGGGVQTQGEDSYLQAMERSLRRNNPTRALISDFGLWGEEKTNFYNRSRLASGYGRPSR